MDLITDILKSVGMFCVRSLNSYNWIYSSFPVELVKNDGQHNPLFNAVQMTETGLELNNPKCNTGHTFIFQKHTVRITTLSDPYQSNYGLLISGNSLYVLL